MSLMSTGRKSVFLVGILCSLVFSQYETAGRTNYQHLLLNYDARSVGLSGANTALPGGIAGVMANPAQLAGIKGKQGFIGYQMVLDGVWGAPLGFAQPYKDYGMFSVMLQGVSSGEIAVIERGADGNPFETGEFASDEYFTPSLSFARTFFDSRIFFGVSAKILYHRISAPPDIYSSKGIAVDVGIQYRYFSDRLILGAVLRNLGYELYAFNNGERYPVPTLFEIGVSYIPRYITSVRICFDINKVSGEYINFQPGAEIEIIPDIIFWRVGYAFSQRDVKELIRKISGEPDEKYLKSNWSAGATGLGVKVKMQQMLVHVDFGLQFRISKIPLSPVISSTLEF